MHASDVAFGHICNDGVDVPSGVVHCTEACFRRSQRQTPTLDTVQTGVQYGLHVLPLLFLVGEFYQERVPQEESTAPLELCIGKGTRCFGAKCFLQSQLDVLPVHTSTGTVQLSVGGGYFGDAWMFGAKVRGARPCRRVENDFLEGFGGTAGCAAELGACLGPRGMLEGENPMETR